MRSSSALSSAPGAGPTGDETGDETGARGLVGSTWSWWGRWRARHVLTAARRLPGARVYRSGASSGVAAPWGGFELTVGLVAHRRRPRLQLTLTRMSTGADGVWAVRPYELDVLAGPYAETFAWVAAPLHAVAAPQDRCWVTPSAIVYQTRHVARPRRWLPRALAALAAVSQDLDPPTGAVLVGDDAPRDPLPALRRLVEDSASPTVRARATALLLARARGPARRQAGIRALMDPNPAIRLMGALEVGALGRPTLCDLLFERALPAGDRRRALAFLRRRFNDAGLLDPLVRLACRPDDELAVAALDAILTADTSARRIAAALTEVVRACRGRPNAERAAAALARVAASSEGRGRLSVAAGSGQGELSNPPAA